MTTKEFRERQKAELEAFAQNKASEVLALMESRALTKTALSIRMGWSKSMMSKIFVYPDVYLKQLGEIEEELR